MLIVRSESKIVLVDTMQMHHQDISCVISSKLKRICLACTSGSSKAKNGDAVAFACIVNLDNKRASKRICRLTLVEV